MFYTQLIALCAKEGVKPTPLIRSLGFSAGNIKRWENGATVNSDILIAVAEHFKVSTDYLLYGKENNVSSISMSDDEKELLSHFSKLSDKSKGIVIGRAEQLAEQEGLKQGINTDETKFIEMSSMSVSAGTGEPLIDDSRPEFIEVKRSDLTEDANFAVQISGDSMLPRFHDKDIVLVRSQPDINIGEIGIFIIDGNGYIKERGKDCLISLNPDYDDIHFKADQDIRCKGLVIATLEDDDFV